MKISSLVTLAGVCIFLPAAVRAQSQQPTASSEISASGIAEMRAAPDHAVLTTTVETRDRTATTATASNSTAANDIVQALRRAGLPAAAINTSDFTVDQYFPPRYDPREPPLPDGFITRTVIRAETDNVGMVSSLIDAALAAGGTRISIQFSSSKMGDARREAIASAFAAAKADAVALAQAAGGRLGRLLSASPSGASPAQIRVTGQLSGTILESPPPYAVTMTPPTSVRSAVSVNARWELIAPTNN